MKVTGKIVLLTMVLAGTFFLSACGKSIPLVVPSSEISSEPITEETKSKQHEGNPENEENSESEESQGIAGTVSTNDIEELKGVILESHEDISAYLSLLDIMGENGLGEDEVDNEDIDVPDTSYALIYFDGDDRQELVIGQLDSFSIYSINSDGVVITLVENLYSVAPAYYERKGIIEEWSRWNGGGDEGSYASSYYVATEENPYKEGRVPDFGYEYNAVYDDDGEWTETGITDYYRDGTIISEDEYNGIFKQYGISEWSDDADEKEEGRVGTKSFFE